MQTETITLSVEADFARAYNSATQSEQEKVQLLVQACLQYYTRANRESLYRTMDEISHTAKSNGLTPEVLDSLLVTE